MRAVVFSVAVAVLAVGCFGSSSRDGLPGGDDALGPPPDDLFCATSADCVEAGASCCSCPEYAVNSSSGFAQACEDVQCPPPEPGTCSGLVAMCEDNRCILGCGPVSCNDITCENGFATDEAGCLTCECMNGPAPECSTDDQCARVHADCCGCMLGGADTAVPVDQVGAWEAGLDCPPDPVCPGVDVCTPGDVPTCDNGRCVLGPGTPSSAPPGACGTPELPPCPTGQTCVLNSDDGATEAGLGVCQ